jgi:uncharacterized protein (TIGR03382 family)
VLQGADTLQATFTAPAASSSTALAFRLTVQDDRGAESSAGTTVTVRNITAVAPGGVKGGCGTAGTGAATAWAAVLLVLLVTWRRWARP